MRASDSARGGILSLVRTALVSGLALLAPAALAQDEPAYEAGVVVVQFDAGMAVGEGVAKTGLAAFDRVASPFGVTSIERPFAFLDHVEPRPETERNLLALRRTYYVRYSADEDPVRVAQALASVDGVTYAEPLLLNRFEGSVAVPDDSLFGEQTYLNHLRLPEAWDVVRSDSTAAEEGMGASPVVIAIVDGGGDWRHEDLLPNVWTNSGEIPGNGRDDDLNGFRDDVHGINLANEDASDNDPTGLPQTPGSAQHGTAVAGVASAATDNGIGIAGAAWNARLMHVNVGCLDRESACHGYRGILYAASNGADIINVSWSGTPRLDEELKMVSEALEFATAQGALVVAAAANGAEDASRRFFPSYPSAHPRVLSVGATERDTRRLASFSNFGKEVNVYAPGEGIVTTAPEGGYIRSLEGTSFAAPLVSGIAALVKSRFPHLSADALREHVRLSSDNMDADNPQRTGRLGSGFVNAERAVQRPSLPGVRVTAWSWREASGDGIVAPGEQVTITGTVTNYLEVAQQLSIGLWAVEPYAFLDLSQSEIAIGQLAGDESRSFRLQFSVGADPPANERIRLFARITDGAFTDATDHITLDINRRLDLVHAALSALYVSTDGDNWTHNHNWDVTTVPTLSELGRWAGVGVWNGWLTELNLQENNLAGTLPPELENLAQLDFLELSRNALIGPIPKELGKLTQLRTLGISETELSGEIPPELGELPLLSSLVLNDNNLSGLIPPELGKLPLLSWLSLIRNDLSGLIPPELGNLSRLRTLRLFDNLLSGPIPPELGDLSQLEFLLLFRNDLSGEIPPELGSLSRLRTLALFRNRLHGEIPPELANLQQLRWLELYDNDLSGEIPMELGNLSNLTRLTLAGNNLSGRIPAELGRLSNLDVLWLQENALTGEIPPELGNLSELGWLKLELNELSGQIPPELGWLSKLQEFYAFRNNLSGPIPPELGNLAQLRELKLGNNSLSGPIPSGLGNLAQLQELTLSYNNLAGPIPPAFGNLAQLRELLLVETGLSGPIPPELGQLAELEYLHLPRNSLSGAIPKELGNLSSLQSLHLEENTLSGPIPPELGRLAKLRRIDLYENSLSGAIPPELGSLAALDHMWLNDNNLSGPIPKELGKLAKLQTLKLHDNSLSGPIPPELANMVALESLELDSNELTGSVPPELGSLAQLQDLHLSGNNLSGPIPPELGDLATLKDLRLQDNDLSGTVPPELGNLTELGGLRLSNNRLTGKLPRSLMQLENLLSIRFEGQDLCAPRDEAFQAWLRSLWTVVGPTCTGVYFAEDIPDASFTRDVAIAPLALPAAAGGSEPYAYSLSPALPAGLVFDDSLLTISGTPTELAARTAYTYKATDADGLADSLAFSMEVVSPVHASGAENLPSEFSVHGNYPNPFRESTRLAFDLPWPAIVTVEVLDLEGRRVRLLPEEALAAGRNRTIEVSGDALSSGLYLYRLSVVSADGRSLHAGRFVRVR